MVSGRGAAGTYRLVAKWDEPDSRRAVERLFREAALEVVRPAERRWEAYLKCEEGVVAAPLADNRESPAGSQTPGRHCDAEIRWASAVDANRGGLSTGGVRPGDLHAVGLGRGRVECAGLDPRTGETDPANRGGPEELAFPGSDAGARRAAILYSIIGTCSLWNVNPEEYLRDILDRISRGWPSSRIEELLPDVWAQAHTPTGTGPPERRIQRSRPVLVPSHPRCPRALDARILHQGPARLPGGVYRAVTRKEIPS